MRLRTRLNLLVAALSAAFVIVLIAAEIEATRDSVREEMEAANRVASQLLGQLTSLYAKIGGPDLVLQFLDQLGRVRANEVYLVSAGGDVLYRSPPATYKAGREAPAWFARLFSPKSARETSSCAAACAWWSMHNPRVPCSMPGTRSCVSRPWAPSC